jgi:hypothetical protein
MESNIGKLPAGFRRELAKLTEFLADFENSRNLRFGEAAEEHSRAIKGLKQCHAKGVNWLDREIRNEQAALVQFRGKFGCEVSRQAARNEMKLVDLEKQLLGDMMAQKVIVEFYHEREAVLKGKADKFERLWEEKPPRECDAEMIQKLQMRLRTVNIQLETAFTGWKGYKALLVEQDQICNRRFGATQIVGTLSAQTPHELEMFVTGRSCHNRRVMNMG